MTREQAIDLILRNGGEPPPNTDEHWELMQFLDTSPECRKLYDEQQATWQALDLWEPIEPSLGFDRQVREKIEELANRQPWYSRWFVVQRPSFAVGLAGLLLVASSVLHQPSLSQPDLHSAALSGDDEAYLEEFNRALDDIEMLAQFDIDPEALTPAGQS